MAKFKILNNLFEKDKDFYKIFNNYGDEAIRYALLRSLDNSDIKELFKDKIDLHDSSKLPENAYNSNLTIDEIVDYIMKRKKEE